MKRLILFVLCLTLMPLSAQATSMALDFNNDSAEFRLDVPMSKDEYGAAIIGGRYLYNEDENTDMVSVEFKFVGDPGAIPGLEVGAGFIGYIGETQDLYDFNNLGVGLMAKYSPATLQGLGFTARIVYSPDIFSWQDSDGLFELNTRVSYSITPKVKVYAGYQKIELELDGVNQDIDVDDDVRVGLQVQF